MTDNFKRAIAAFVDFYIILAISSLLVAIVTLGKLTLTTFTTILYLVSCLVLVVSKDFVFKNASVGKRIFNLRVVKEVGTKFWYQPLSASVFLNFRLLQFNYA
jgi:uncharacterized RDD family membrane protein YckC